MMSLLNEIEAAGSINRAEYQAFLILLNPFAPHVTEEIWEKQAFGGMLSGQKWVEYDPAKCIDAEVEIAVQVNGKIKCRLKLPVDCSKEEAVAKAKEAAAAALEGKTVVKEICVPGKLVNLVAK